MSCITGGRTGAYSNFSLKIRIWFFLFLQIGITAACAPTHTQYQEVYIPQKCDIALPVRPARSESAALMIVDLIEYTQKLEYALNACKGE